MHALAPVLLVLPQGVLVELGAEVYAPSTLKNVQVSTCIEQAMHFTKSLLWFILDTLEQCFGHLAKCVVAISLQLPRLIEASHKVGDDDSNLGNFNWVNQILSLLCCDLAPSNLDKELVEQFADLVLWCQNYFLTDILVDFSASLRRLQTVPLLEFRAVFNELLADLVRFKLIFGRHYSLSLVQVDKSIKSVDCLHCVILFVALRSHKVRCLSNHCKCMDIFVEAELLEWDSSFF